MNKNIRIVENATVFPLKIFEKNKSNNIVYDDFYPVPEANLFRGINVNFFSYEDVRESVGEVEKINGNTIYLGIIDVHYGHAISEGLSRLHGFDLTNVDNFLFSYRIDRQVQSIEKNKIFHRVIKYLEPYGNILFIDKVMQCEKLYIPKQAFILGYRCDDFHFEYLYKIFKVEKERENNGKIYLSRKHIKDERKYYDENELESELTLSGFDIIYPEKLTLEEQIEVFKGCEVIVGMEGTALLNSIWNRNENLKVISIGYENQRNKAQRDLCDAKNASFELINLKQNKTINNIVRSILNASF